MQGHELHPSRLTQERWPMIRKNQRGELLEIPNFPTTLKIGASASEGVLILKPMTLGYGDDSNGNAITSR